MLIHCRHGDSQVNPLPDIFHPPPRDTAKRGGKGDKNARIVPVISGHFALGGGIPPRGACRGRRLSVEKSEGFTPDGSSVIPGGTPQTGLPRPAPEPDRVTAMPLRRSRCNGWFCRDKSPWPAPRPRLLHSPQGEIENGPLIHFPFGPCSASMTLYDALDGCQPDSVPLEFIFAMQPLKRRE